MMLAECRKLTAHRKLYIIVMTCCSVNELFLTLVNTQLKFQSKYSIIIKISSKFAQPFYVFYDGITISSSLGVKRLSSISDNNRRIAISRITFLHSQLFLKIFEICLIATNLPVCMHLAFITYPKLPAPMQVSNSYLDTIVFHTLPSFTCYI